MVSSFTGGTFTIPVSGPGVLAGTSVTDALCTATSNIAVSMSTRSVDAIDSFDLVIVPGSGSFTATCVRAQLTTTLTVNYVLINTA